ncbi:acyl-CoA thioesterase, partial [Enterococcus faecalis]
LICSNYETRRQQRLAFPEETKLFSQHLTTDLRWIDSPL